VRLWVKHYNHQRPHQALDGLCPADRFFAIAQELRQVIERGIQENVLELALRGQPCSPFYMVGRMGEQFVVIAAGGGNKYDKKFTLDSPYSAFASSSRCFSNWAVHVATGPRTVPNASPVS